MKSSNRQKYLIYVLVVVCIIGAVHFYNKYYGGDIVEILTETEQPTIVGEDILIMVNKLESVSIDTTLFQDPLFISLIDSSVPLIDEVEGRLNPFAPIGSN